EGAQEAHEAIRPTNVRMVPGSLADLEKDAARIYELIWKQFVACQMPAADYISTGVTVEAEDYELRARGRVLVFDGFTKVLPPVAGKEEDQELPDFKVGEKLGLQKLDPKQHFTKPAPRYTEASLVKELEKRGIGRPSTYANIISTIQERGYVRLESRRFCAEKMGEIVTDRLVENFEELMSYGFTAGMEVFLDDVAEGNKIWTDVLDSFYEEFSGLLDKAYNNDNGMRPNNPTDIDLPCPNCGRNMQVRTAATGVFLGCSGYSLSPSERCKKTINLIHGDETIREGDAEAESQHFRELHRCPICGTAMDHYLIDETRRIHICGNNPDCSGYEIEKGKFKIKGYDGPVLQCEKCGAEMQLKTGRFGKYFACTGESCKNTRKLLRNGEPAPPKMDPVPMPELICEKVDDFYLLRDGAGGLFLAASKFPQHRETRAPLVLELKAHAQEIDPKYAYLLTAPTEDPDGNKAMVRYLRKTKEQYVLTEKDTKPTGWRAFYADGKWTVEDKRKNK
ncbi:MAG: topoisomerase DNA-binding C4 zinc finger domain-containing protein, partial [Spirochaetales bacterium]|nr:topoisomerase DNA-binding C4 zinc finger domain-containing protein [Spirochaetales bacterium]